MDDKLGLAVFLRKYHLQKYHKCRHPILIPLRSLFPETVFTIRRDHVVNVTADAAQRSTVWIAPGLAA